MARISRWMRRRPVFAFYVLAFAISWLGWMPQAAHSHGLFPFDSLLFYILGGVGPMLSALIVLRVLHGKDGGGELFEPLFRWRIGAVWYLVALFGFAATWLAAVAWRGQPGPELENIWRSLAVLPALVGYVFAAIGEEVAWRGFALPRLQSHHSALVSSLTLGLVWGVWHLPLLLTKGNVMSTYPLIPFFMQTMAICVVYTWLYNNTQGSVLIVTIFHAASNILAGPFVGAEQATVTCLVAAVLVIVFGPALLSHRRQHVVPSLTADITISNR